MLANKPTKLGYETHGDDRDIKHKPEKVLEVMELIHQELAMQPLGCEEIPGGITAVGEDTEIQGVSSPAGDDEVDTERAASEKLCSPKVIHDSPPLQFQDLA